MARPARHLGADQHDRSDSLPLDRGRHAAHHQLTDPAPTMARHTHERLLARSVHGDGLGDVVSLVEPHVDSVAAMAVEKHPGVEAIDLRVTVRRRHQKRHDLCTSAARHGGRDGKSTSTVDGEVDRHQYSRNMLNRGQIGSSPRDLSPDLTVQWRVGDTPTGESVIRITLV